MAKDFPLVNLITSLKEPTVWPRSACGGQDCHGEEGFPTARGKESIEELVMAAGGGEWTEQKPPGRHVRGAISRNLREAGMARAQDRRQSKEKEARSRQVPHKGVFLHWYQTGAETSLA